MILAPRNHRVAEITFAVLVLLATFACKKHIITGEHPPELVGTWELVWGHDCSDYGLKSDFLLLHADGTLEQHVLAKDGRRFDSTTEHWRYTGNSVAFDVRHNFFTSQSYEKLIGVPEGEVLIVHFDSPPVILLNPDSDCLYKKTR